LGSGKSRLEVAQGFGLKFEVTPRISSGLGQEVEEGIHAVRMLLARCWFDGGEVQAGPRSLTALSPGLQPAAERVQSDAGA
jgi:hypothetical protein